MRKKMMILTAGILLALLPFPALSQVSDGAYGYVSFITTPPGATVYINNPIGTTPITDYKIAPGTYLYSIIKDGFVPVQKSFSVNADEHITVTNNLQPLAPTFTPTTPPTQPPSGRGSIYATTSPSGASIYLNGNFQGYSPLAITDLQPRTYTVLARLQGYTDYAQSVQVYSNAQSRFDAVLQPSPVHRDYGYISASSSPSGASVYVDSSYRGTTPATITEFPGIHTVELELSGYYDSSQQISVTAGSTQYVSVTLSPIPQASGGSILVISSPPVASVFLDGSYRGQTSPGGTLAISNLPSGTYQVKVTRPQYYDFLTTVSVSPGIQTSVQATLSPISSPVTPTQAPGQTGTLSVSSTPSGAQVYIDNIFKGITPGDFGGLSAGMHTVTLKNPGYSDFQGSFEVSAGQATPVSATLNPLPTPTPSRSASLLAVTGLIGAGMLLTWRKRT